MDYNKYRYMPSIYDTMSHSLPDLNNLDEVNAWGKEFNRRFEEQKKMFDQELKERAARSNSPRKPSLVVTSDLEMIEPFSYVDDSSSNVVVDTSFVENKRKEEKSFCPGVNNGESITGIKESVKEECVVEVVEKKVIEDSGKLFYKDSGLHYLPSYHPVNESSSPNLVNETYHYKSSRDDPSLPLPKRSLDDYAKDKKNVEEVVNLLKGKEMLKLGLYQENCEPFVSTISVGVAPPCSYPPLNTPTVFRTPKETSSGVLPSRDWVRPSLKLESSEVDRSCEKLFVYSPIFDGEVKIHLERLVKLHDISESVFPVKEFYLKENYFGPPTNLSPRNLKLVSSEYIAVSTDLGISVTLFSSGNSLYVRTEDDYLFVIKFESIIPIGYFRATMIFRTSGLEFCVFDSLQNSKNFPYFKRWKKIGGYVDAWSKFEKDNSKFMFQGYKIRVSRAMIRSLDERYRRSFGLYGRMTYVFHVLSGMGNFCKNNMLLMFERKLHCVVKNHEIFVMNDLDRSVLLSVGLRVSLADGIYFCLVSDNRLEFFMKSPSKGDKYTMMGFCCPAITPTHIAEFLRENFSDRKSNLNSVPPLDWHLK